MNRLAALLLACLLPASARADAPAAPGHAASAAALAPAPAPAAPVAPVREVVETLHGVPVSDPYRWLEDVASPETQAYLRAEDDYARRALERIPGRAALAARIREISAAQSTVRDIALAGGKVFYLKLAPGGETAVLCVRDGFQGAERVLVDPARFSTGAGRGAIDWYRPSPDGRLVAYGASAGGSRDSILRLLEVRDARDTGVAIDRTRFNAGLAWHHDGRAFYYARVPEGGQADIRHRYAGIRVYRHVVGRPAAQDEIVFASALGGAREVPEHAYPSLVVPEDSTHAYAVVRDGVSPDIAVYMTPVRELAKGLPRWTRIVAFDDGVTALQAWKDDIYLLTHKDAPLGRVLALKAGRDGVSRPRVAVPEGEAAIVDIGLAADALYLRETVGGLERLERLNLRLGASRTPEFVKTDFDRAIAQMLTHPARPGAVLRLQGFIEPPIVATIEAKTGNMADTGLEPAPRADFSAMDEVRLYARSRDGTKVPLTLLYRKTTMLTADHPTILVAAGAYGIAQAPEFDATRLAWLERGGIIVFAHVRGGGEYGEAWHRGGMREAKGNTVDDVIACAEFLVKYGFTSPARLAVEGTGAGGIAAAGAMVRRPDLFAAVVPRVAIVDMLRQEFSAEGPARVPEFGSVATAEGFAALRRISPYQQVKDGTAYPAVLLTTGMDDAGADPWQAAKMAARLQAASSGGKPVLLRVEWRGGHGRGATRSQRDEERADIYAFLLWQFGDRDFTPEASGATALAAPAGSSAAGPAAASATPATAAGN